MSGFDVVFFTSNLKSKFQVRTAVDMPDKFIRPAQHSISSQQLHSAFHSCTNTEKNLFGRKYMSFNFHRVLLLKREERLLESLWTSVSIGI